MQLKYDIKKQYKNITKLRKKQLENKTCSAIMYIANITMTSHDITFVGIIKIWGRLSDILRFT